MLSGVEFPPYATSGVGRRSGGAGITPLGVSTAAGKRPSRVVARSARSSTGSSGMSSCSGKSSASARGATRPPLAKSTTSAAIKRRARRILDAIALTARVRKGRQGLGGLELVEFREIQRHHGAFLGEDVD